MTFREALQYGARRLEPHRCDGADAARESEALLAAATRLPRERFLTDPAKRLTAAQERRYRAALSRRRRHEPLAYLLGTAWFMGREFAVDRRVLIPRPATEHVVSAAVDAARSRGARTFVDAGTGSGCIAVSAALALPGVDVIATDASAAALAVARKNSRRHGRAGRIRFRGGDLLLPAVGALGSGGPSVVVANLPYIPAGAMRRLSPCVRREPRQALVGGKDGLAPFRRLLAQLAAAAPARPLTVVFECLPGQFAPLVSALKKNFPGARAGKILNFEGTCVGLRADV